MLRNRRERGEGQFGCLVGLIVLALGVFIAWKMVPVKVKAAEVRQVVVDEAKSAGTHNDKVIMGNILSKAHEDNIPLTEENGLQSKWTTSCRSSSPDTSISGISITPPRTRYSDERNNQNPR